MKSVEVISNLTDDILQLKTNDVDFKAIRKLYHAQI